jgi:hypothetical protein
MRGCGVTGRTVGLESRAGVVTSRGVGLEVGRGFGSRFAGAGATSFTLKLAVIVASAAPVFRFTAAG